MQLINNKFQMRYTIIFFFFVLSNSISIYSQTVLTIEKIDVSNILKNDTSEILKEGENDGPYINLRYCISNESNKTIKLLPKESKMYLHFKVKNNSYTIKLIPVSFMEKDSVILNPLEQFTGVVGDYIFLGTDLLKSSKKDYCIDLIESIPTIKVEYIEMNLTLISSGVLNVNVINP